MIGKGFNTVKSYEGLGYKYLLPEEQIAYNIFLDAFSSKANSVDCSKIARSIDLMRVIQTVLGDNPSIQLRIKRYIKRIKNNFSEEISILKKIESLKSYAEET